MDISLSHAALTWDSCSMGSVSRGLAEQPRVAVVSLFLLI